MSRNLLSSALDMNNYFKRFNLLLHLEEMQMEVDIRKYDLHAQTMTRDPENELLVLKVKKCWSGHSCFVFLSRHMKCSMQLSVKWMCVFLALGLILILLHALQPKEAKKKDGLLNLFCCRCCHTFSHLIV